MTRIRKMNDMTNTAVSIMENIREYAGHFLSLKPENGLITLILLICAIAIAIIGYYVTKCILKVVAYIVEKTETDWDDDLINTKLLKAISQMAPALILDLLLPYCFINDNTFQTTIHILTAFYIIAIAVYAVNTFLDNLFNAFYRREQFKPFAVKGIFQMVKLIIMGIGIIIALSILVGKTPIAILTALGASAAILMLVFKDTIMGLVASVQLTANSMLQKGDWIIVPKHNANGEVTDISLTTIKIRNWDNSITTVPPYSLVSDSFQNYQAMRKSGGRRICRAVYIDVNSVRFFSSEEMASLEDDGLIPESEEENQHTTVNIGLFRRYLEDWIYNMEYTKKTMMFMVRQLEPTPTGIPLELYFFVNRVEWKVFEHIQSDVFDHVYAMAPRFGLTIFQNPTGKDLMTLKPSIKDSVSPNHRIC